MYGWNHEWAKRRASALNPAMDGAGAMDNLRLPTAPWKALRPFHTAHSLVITSSVKESP